MPAGCLNDDFDAGTELWCAGSVQVKTIVAVAIHGNNYLLNRCATNADFQTCTWGSLIRTSVAKLALQLDCLG